MDYDYLMKKIEKLISYMYNDLITLSKKTTNMVNNNIENYLSYNRIKVNRSFYTQTTYYWIECNNSNLYKIQENLRNFLIITKKNLDVNKQTHNNKKTIQTLENNFNIMINSLNIFQNTLEYTKSFALKKYSFQDSYTENGILAIKQAFNKSYSLIEMELNQIKQQYYQQFVNNVLLDIKNYTGETQNLKSNKEVINANNYYSKLLKATLTEKIDEVDKYYKLWNTIDDKIKNMVIANQSNNLQNIPYVFIVQNNINRAHKFFLEHNMQNMANYMEQMLQILSSRNINVNSWNLLVNLMNYVMKEDISNFSSLAVQWEYVPNNLKNENYVKYETEFLEIFTEIQNKTKILNILMKTYQILQEQQKFTDLSMFINNIVNQIKEKETKIYK